MEPVGNLFHGECNSFIGMSTEEADFMSQLFGYYSFPRELDEVLSSFWTSKEPTKNMEGGDSYYCSDPMDSDLLYSNGSNFFSPTSGNENYSVTNFNPILVTSNSSIAMNVCMVEDQNNSSLMETLPNILMENVVCLQDAVCLNKESNGSLGESCGIPLEAGDLLVQKLKLKRKSQMQEPKTTDANSSENFKKKLRVSDNVKRYNKNVQSKDHNIALASKDEVDTNAGLNGQSPSSNSSEDDSNASQVLNGGASTSCSIGSAALNLNGRSRSSRGSATDPQSLYARKRRERINERLRILQNLVPNGTKVDISTMLEEAVQYVKFLQLQIKLLSSDDLWMYAPIACNGMNIGLDRKISPSG